MEEFVKVTISDVMIDQWRDRLDPYYHDQYISRRQRIQNDIIRGILAKLKVSNFISDNSFTQALIVAGPIGAGKSTIVQRLQSEAANTFLVIDIDEIRSMLPESRRYQESCPHLYANLTQKEAGTIVELLIHIALSFHLSIIVDSSLRDREWHAKFYFQLLQKHIGLKISLIHVTASKESIYRRVHWRNSYGTPRRIVSDDAIETSYAHSYNIHEYIPIFRSLCKVIVSIDNTTEDNYFDKTFSPSVIYPWHLNWNTMLKTLKMANPMENEKRVPIFRLIEATNTTSSDTAESFYTAAYDGDATTIDEATDTREIESPINTEAFFMPETFLEKAEVSDDGSDNLGPSTTASLSMTETLTSIESKPSPTSIIERLRQYRGPGSAARAQKQQNNSHFVCFICRIDKLPASNTYCPFSAKNHQIKSGIHQHT